MDTLKVIAFEGINRAGKGTQIQLLKEYIWSHLQINGIVLRGDGTREGRGDHDGDPHSPYWIHKVEELRSKGTNQEWDYASYILAQELIAWKKELSQYKQSIILLDRSLISRGSFILKREYYSSSILNIDDLYPIQPGRKIAIGEIVPDIIFELVVPKQIALQRLNPVDPKLAFRQKVIHETYDIFYKTKEKLPECIQEKIVTINSSKHIDHVFADVLTTLKEKLQLFL